MKALHVLQYSLPRLIGYTVRSDGLLRGAQANGIDVVVLTGQLQATETGASEEIKGVRYLRMKEEPTPSTPGVRHLTLLRRLEARLRQAIREERPDIVHVHSPAYNGLAALRAAREFNTPVVYEVRGTWEDAAVDQGKMTVGSIPYRASRALETFVLRRADHTVGICEGLRSEFLTRGIPDERISVVRNGVETEFFKPAARDEQLARELGIAPGPLFCFFGTLFRYEGVEDLVDAIPEALARASDARFLIVGGGEREREVREAIERVGRPDSVLYRPRVPHAQIPSFYSLADVMVYPRRKNRLTDMVTPLKPLEAIAMGKAVLASNCHGHCELIESDRTGILYEAGNRRSLIEAIARLAHDDELRRRLADEGRRRAIAERNWTMTTRPYLEAYERATARRNRQRN